MNSALTRGKNHRASGSVFCRANELSNRFRFFSGHKRMISRVECTGSRNPVFLSGIRKCPQGGGLSRSGFDDFLAGTRIGGLRNGDVLDWMEPPDD